MAKFKLFLLNIDISRHGSSRVVSKMPISEFDTNQSSQTFCYTFDEKFQRHQNTQRTLTFSMCRDIIREDRIERNPFINHLYIGAQLQLIDKHDKHHLMTVSKITYEFGSLNTTFKYECQDSFNYQLSRQNSGYEIENNIDDVDFIGARTLDWWVLCKIQPDCNISYTYKKLADDFKIQTSSSKYKILKPKYIGKDYEDLHRTIPFAASGTANSVLIELGEQYGLQLKVYERVLDDGQIDKYYWFEPAKSLNPSGLKYSPFYNMQSFGLEHLGTSFSSVLNVQSHQLGEEMITLIPEVPAFFRKWFMSKEWNDSKYAPGLFLSACQEKVDFVELNLTSKDVTLDTTNGYVYIPITNIDWDVKYDAIKFTTNGGSYSTISLIAAQSIVFNSKYQQWPIYVYVNKSFVSVTTPTECLHQTVYIRLKYTESNLDNCNIKLYVSQYRNASTEEKDFALIADQIPWLENRLIDFTYFLDHSIINARQYRDLMTIFEDKLRKVNAKLLLYSQLYYNSIQMKTQIMAKLSSKLDLIGATFQSDLVHPYQTDGRVKKTSDFQLSLSDLFSNKNNPVELIDYHITLADYVNKYVSAEQTFLKNMYLFREYFYQPCGLNTLYEYKWILNNNFNDKYVYLFSDNINQYTKLTESNFGKGIFIKEDSNYLTFDTNNIVTPDKVQQNPNRFYCLDPNRTDYKRIVDQSEYQGWSKDATYYELQWIKTKNTTDNDYNTLISKFEDQNVIITFDNKYRIEKLTNDDISISCYLHCLHTTEDNDNKVELQFSSSSDSIEINLTKSRVWVKTNLAEMRNNYFYQAFVSKNTILNNKSSIHYHATDAESLIKPLKTGFKSFGSLGLDKNVLKYLGEAKNWTANRVETDDSNTIYGECFPLSSWYYKETVDNKDVYHSIPFVNIENCNTFMRRIAISTTARNNHLIWGGIVGFAVLGPIGTGIVHGLTDAAVKNKDLGLGNDGWTYKDVFANESLDSEFQGYYDGTKIVYTPNEEKYAEAIAKREGVVTEDGGATSLSDIDKWDSKAASGLLFTFNSYADAIQQNEGKYANKYAYKASYWRILDTNSYITRTDSIKVIVLDTDNRGWINNPNVQEVNLPYKGVSGNKIKRLDSLIYYPLSNLMETIAGSDLKWGESKKDQELITLSELGWSLDTSFPWLYHKESGDYAIFLKEENFVYKELSTLLTESSNITPQEISILASQQYYDNKTMQKIDLIKECEDISRGYYISGLNDIDYISLNTIENLTEQNLDDYEIYEKINGNWVRCYTKQQLINRNDAYVRTDNIHIYQSFSPIESSVDIKMHRYIRQDDDSLKYDTLVSAQIKENDTLDGWMAVVDNIQLDLVPGYTNDSFCKTNDLGLLTNAQYWYEYRHDKNTCLMEQAMLIETNLTDYWTQAYYASKNCKYFLPEFWQLAVDQTKNYYSTNILSITNNEDEPSTTNNAVELSSTYVPMVEKIVNQHQFLFRHTSQLENDNTIQMEQKYNLPLSEQLPLSKIIAESGSLRDIFNYLNLTPEAWVGINIRNDFTEYKHNAGGTLWTEELKTRSGGALSYPDQFGGWYDMMIKVLLSCNYQDYSPVLYKQAQQEHNQIWAELYAQYSHLILEQSYTNENATTSEELLQLAQYAFKDYSQIESNYNITVIDPWTLSGYAGQELKIGDGIEVDANELYDDQGSDVYKSLIQYLYITDINYDLRRDDNIQLTVNSIKYQDKVIGELVKLIR